MAHLKFVRCSLVQDAALPSSASGSHSSLVRARDPGGLGGVPSTASRRTRLSPPCASNSGALGGSPSMEVFHPSRSPRFPDIWIHPGIKCKEPPTHRGRACAHIARRLASLTGTGWQLRPVSQRDGRVDGVFVCGKPSVGALRVPVMCAVGTRRHAVVDCFCSCFRPF